MTRFQQRVYNIVKRIPRGKVATYKVVARAIGNPRAMRAVGNALNKNRDKRMSCHRVIRSDGMVGGFARGTKEKIRLLRSEKVMIINKKAAVKHIISKF